MRRDDEPRTWWLNGHCCRASTSLTVMRAQPRHRCWRPRAENAPSRSSAACNAHAPPSFFHAEGEPHRAHAFSRKVGFDAFESLKVHQKAKSCVPFVRQALHLPISLRRCDRRGRAWHVALPVVSIAAVATLISQVQVRKACCGRLCTFPLQQGWGLREAPTAQPR